MNSTRTQSLSRYADHPQRQHKHSTRDARHTHSSTHGRTPSHSDSRSNGNANRQSAHPPLQYSHQRGLLSLFIDSVTSLFKLPPKFAALFLALALAIPAAIAILSDGLDTAQKNLTQNRYITVFLNSRVSAPEGRQLASTIAGNKLVRFATLVPTSIRESEILTIDIQPSIELGPAELDAVVSELTGHSSVDYVDFNEAWLEQNTDAVHTTKKLAYAATAVAALLTMMLVFTLSYIDLRRYRPTQAVLNQMGASRSTIVKPLLLRCLLITLVAVGIGTMLAWGALEILTTLGDLSSYRQILPSALPLQRVLMLAMIAIGSCFLTVKLLSRKI